MQDWLSARASISPDKMALYYNLDEASLQFTFSQLDQHVQTEALRLYALGIRRGQHIAIAMYSTHKEVIAMLALMRIGCIVVPINTRLTHEEISFQCRQSDATALLCYDKEYMAHYADIPHCPQIHTNVIDTNNITLPESSIDLEAPFLIMYTSGTSGKPKGALITYGAVYHNAMASAYHNGTMPHDRWLCILPLFHIGGLSILIRSILYGTAVDLLSRFDDERVNRYLATYPVSLVSLVPTMLHRLLKIKSSWHDALRLVLLGGAAPMPELVQICLDEGIQIATTYGLTEASSQVATSTPENVIKKPGSVGKPLLFTCVRIIDEKGSDVLPTEIGEIIVNSPTIMQGYYRNMEASAKTLREGWLHTGDMGYFDEDGDLFIVQRRSDLILTGGENVYPAEIEAILRGYPNVEDACVVGISDAEWGQIVGAVIVWKTPISEDIVGIEAYARQHLAGYKIPRRIISSHNLPRNPAGKISRMQVQELFA